MRPPAFQPAVLNAKNTGAPYAVATVISAERPADINAQVTYNARLEGCLKTVVVTTGGNGALCGVRLKLNTKYVLSLMKDGSSSRIGLCDV